MTITSDWHIHSRNSCDDACLPIATLISRAAELGITDYGVSDHIHTPYNLPDIAASRKEYLENRPGPRFHFGIEASCVSQWEIDEVVAGRGGKDPTYGIRQGGPPGAPLAIAITQKEIEDYGIEYVIGGVHWVMYVPYEREAVIRDFFRQYMFMATHPLITIVAHPWWWHTHWQEPDGRYITDPWLDDFRKVPQSMHDEFAAAVIQHKKLVEINAEAMLLNPGYPESFKHQYLDYLAGLKAKGVRFSFATDCHDQGYLVNIARAEQMLDTVGITDADFWKFPPRK